MDLPGSTGSFAYVCRSSVVSFRHRKNQRKKRKHFFLFQHKRQTLFCILGEGDPDKGPRPPTTLASRPVLSGPTGRLSSLAGVSVSTSRKPLPQTNSFFIFWSCVCVCGRYVFTPGSPRRRLNLGNDRRPEFSGLRQDPGGKGCKVPIRPVLRRRCRESCPQSPLLPLQSRSRKGCNFFFHNFFVGFEFFFLGGTVPLNPRRTNDRFTDWTVLHIFLF